MPSRTAAKVIIRQLRHQADAAFATVWRNLRPAPPVIDPQLDDVHHLERAETLIGRTELPDPDWPPHRTRCSSPTSTARWPTKCATC